MAPCCAYHVFVIHLGKLVDLVHCIAGRSNANMSWIFLEIPPGNLLKICSVKFIDTLMKYFDFVIFALFCCIQVLYFHSYKLVCSHIAINVCSSLWVCKDDHQSQWGMELYVFICTCFLVCIANLLFSYSATQLQVWNKTQCLSVSVNAY